MNEIVKELSLKEQLLELMMLDIRYFGKDSFGNHIPVTKLPIELKNFLNKYPLGGVILFHENLHDIHEIKQLTIDLQENSKFGRFIAVDEEGGVISRITGATETPGNMALGATNDLKTTTKVAALIGKELSALGINFNLAPCLDINSNPQNPIIGVRSFGQNPELVAKQGTAYIEGLQDEQIISCAKHFPGHGSAKGDSHLGFVDVTQTWQPKELEPYQLLLNHPSSCGAVMTAHVVNRQLDDTGLPATLSHKILTGLLREKLHFQGVIISDDMQMKAIRDHYGLKEALTLAINAGVDMLIVANALPGEPDDPEMIIQLIEDQVKAGAISPARIDDAYQRIIQLKKTIQ